MTFSRLFVQLSSTAVLFSGLASSAFAADVDMEALKAEIASAHQDAGTQLALGKKQGSLYLDGTWVFTKRLCVSDLTQEAIDNPAEVKDTSRIVNIANYTEAGDRSGNTINADANPNSLGCITQAEGIYYEMPVDIRVSKEMRITAIMASRVDVRKRTGSCAATYQGPKVAPFANIIKKDKDNFYFFLPPGQLAGTAAACANPNHYNLDLVTRMPVLK